MKPKTKPKRAPWGSKPRLKQRPEPVALPAGAPNPFASNVANPATRRGNGAPKYKPEYCETARKLCDHGLTDLQIADFFDVSTFTIWRWRQVYPAFAEAVEMTDERRIRAVENSLYLRATGYSHPAVKIFGPTGPNGKPVVVPYTEYYPPDTQALHLWLLNRNPKKWKRRMAPPDDIPPPGAQDEARRKRAEALKMLVSAIEERARTGQPPIFAENNRELPKTITVQKRGEGALGATKPPTNGKPNGGNGHG